MQYSLSIHTLLGQLIFNSVKVAEGPPFEKELLTQLTICSVCILTITRHLGGHYNPCASMPSVRPSVRGQLVNMLITLEPYGIF